MLRLQYDYQLNMCTCSLVNGSALHLVMPCCQRLWSVHILVACSQSTDCIKDLSAEDCSNMQLQLTFETSSKLRLIWEDRGEGRPGTHSMCMHHHSAEYGESGYTKKLLIILVLFSILTRDVRATLHGWCYNCPCH